MRSNEQGELVASYRWTGWVWKTTTLSSSFKGNYWPFKIILRIYLKLIKKFWKITTCNRSDLETLESRLIIPKNLPRHGRGLYKLCSVWPFVENLRPSRVSNNYTKYCIQCHLLFGVYIYIHNLMYIYYQIKMLMFYNVQITNLTFVAKNWHIQQIIIA